MKTKTTTLLSAATLALCSLFLSAANGLAADRKSSLNTADEKFVKHEAAAGKAVVKIAGLGVKKTQRADIKAFAEMLVTDHTLANEELATLAEAKGVELSTVIDPKHASTYQELEKHSGTDFDKEFLATLVNGHKKCVSSFEDAAKDSQDNDLKLWAQKTLLTLNTHLEKAKELASE